MQIVDKLLRRKDIDGRKEKQANKENGKVIKEGEKRNCCQALRQHFWLILWGLSLLSVVRGGLNSQFKKKWKALCFPLFMATFPEETLCVSTFLWLSHPPLLQAGHLLPPEWLEEGHPPVWPNRKTIRTDQKGDTSSDEKLIRVHLIWSHSIRKWLISVQENQ